MIHLLDVNVLLALLDTRHVGHRTAHDWFSETGADGFATCPITQNGFLRIASSRAYAEKPLNVADLMEMLEEFCARPAHRFWSEDFSLLDQTLVAGPMITGSGQVTDTYLLALAVRNRGRLATFDRRLSPRAVRGGGDALIVLNARTS